MYKSLATFSLLALLTATALADGSSRVERHYEFEVSDIRELQIDARVGSIRLEPTQDDVITVELVIEAESATGWIPFLGRDRDVSAMELEHRVRNNQLLLHFDENHVKTDWVVHLPALEQLRVDLGVGAIEGELPAMPAEVDLGVGSVELTASAAATGQIELDVGVGDTRIRGISGSESRNAIVGSESSAWGDGEHRIRIEVGVGDISLRLEGTE